MGRIVVSQFITLDGVVQDPGGSEGFERGGWVFQFDRGADGDDFKLGEALASDALLLGRVTYQGFAEAWPSRTGEFADKFNGMRKYVVSRTLGEAEWNNTTVIEGNVVEGVSRLRQEPGGDILVNGSVQLVQTLLAHGLVDELRLMVFPVVLGKGKRLFGEGTDVTRLRAAETRQVGPDGVLVLTYETVDDTSPA
jgi:dihydrofolate reductase